MSLIVLVWLAEDAVPHHTQDVWPFLAFLNLKVFGFKEELIPITIIPLFYNDYQFPLYVFGPQLILIAAGGGNFSSAPLANIGPTE